MKPLHYAGVITGVAMKDNMAQVTATCSLGEGAPQLSLALPIAAEDRGQWAMEIGTRIVLSLQLVTDDEPTTNPEAAWAPPQEP